MLRLVAWFGVIVVFGSVIGVAVDVAVGVVVDMDVGIVDAVVDVGCDGCDWCSALTVLFGLQLQPHCRWFRCCGGHC